MFATSRLKKVTALQRVFWCGLLLLSGASRAWSQGGIPAAQLTALKAATVLVLVEAPDEESSGSGFLIAKDGEYGYIATNEHVVNTEIKRGRRVQVVFQSGAPGMEQVLSAEVVAEDESRDLALLKVRSTQLPQPLKLSTPQAPQETQQVWVLGFPFGEMLATNKLHPAMTITTGTITSLRLDDYGKVTRVQVDADINEGNSGGPIVDATGGLVGIATEKVEDTKIGLGLPASELQELLRGRVKEAGFHLLTNKTGEVTYHAAVILIDPLHRVRSVSVFFVPQSQVKDPKPGPDGRYGQIAPDMQEFPLAFKDNEYGGTVTLKSPQLTDAVFLQQIRLEVAEGQFKWTQPIPLRVLFSQGADLNGAPQPGGKTPNAGGDDWLGGAAVPQPGQANGAGAPNLVPVDSNRMLLGEPQTEAGATFRMLDVGDKITPTMRWSNDAKFLYLLDDSGTLRKVSVPEFREEKVLKMGQKTSYMTLTGAGLAIGLPLLQEVWLLDANTLKILKRIPVGGMTGLTGSPLVSKAYVTLGDGVMSVIDLKTGGVITQWKAKEFQQPGDEKWDLGDFHFAQVTADGRYLISGDDNINRLKIDGDTLTYEEAGPGIGWGQNPQQLIVSADSRYVALTAGGGNGNAPGHPQVGPYSTFVYKITDLKTPVLTLNSGAYPHTLAFDKVGGYIYAQNFGVPLMLYTPAGLQEKTFHLGFKRGEQPDQFLPHPQGRKLLVLAGGKVAWVELAPPA